MTRAATAPLTQSGPGVAAALRFLAQARRDPELHGRVAALDPEAGLGPLLQLAGSAGFSFGEADLRAAHAHDWALRRARLQHASPATSAASTVAVVTSPSSST